MSAPGCDGHDSVSAEARALAELLAEALEPWAQRLRDTVDARGGQPCDDIPISCTWCPICAVLGLLRGERPELAARLAEHGVGLLTALRELLAGTGTVASDDTGADTADHRKPTVQQVPLRRGGGTRQQAGRGGDTGC